MATFTHKEQCPTCGSHDNLARYDDGSATCFGAGCSHYEHAPKGGYSPDANRSQKRMSNQNNAPVEGTVRALKSRKLTEESCRKWKYEAGTYKGQPCQIANYYAKNKLVSQKIKFMELKTDGKDKGKLVKTFRMLKYDEHTPLYGQWLWSGGKRLVITEGELDAITVSQMQGHKWPVVSLSDGAGSAVKNIKENIEFVEKFDEVVLMFDMDEAGQANIDDVVGIISAGKVKVAKLPFKDANECLKNGQGAAIVQAIWQAEGQRPDDIITLDDEAIFQQVLVPPKMGLPWPYPQLTKLVYGRRKGVYVFGAGTGIGKTDIITEIIEQTVNELNLKAGVFYFEQPYVETFQRLAGKFKNKTFHIPDTGHTPEELKEALTELRDNKNLFLFNSKGNADWDLVESKIRYLFHHEGIEHFFIDHLTALADTTREKESLEELMKCAALLAVELGLYLYIVSHLSTPKGDSHEEGGRVSSSHFKGSRAIGFWAHYMFGLERNKQAEDPEERRIMTFRIVKDRFTGRADGETFLLKFDLPKGRNLPYERPAEDMGPDTGDDDCPF